MFLNKENAAKSTAQLLSTFSAPSQAPFFWVKLFMTMASLMIGYDMI
jgi:hypothetical protein